jgi:hypothetical protein
MSSTPDPVSTPGTDTFDLVSESEDVPLSEGAYTYSGFEPAITFELDEGWRSGHLSSEFFDVHKGDAAVAFASPTWVRAGSGDEVDAKDMSAGEFTHLLLSDPNLQGEFLPDWRSKEFSGYVVEIDPKEDSEAIFGGVTESFAPSPGPRYRIIVGEVDGGLMVVMPIALREPYEPAFETAEEVVTSLTFD